jgi:hypothetical protein
MSFGAFISNLNAESIIDTWNFPAKTKMESNKRREGMYNIIYFQLMGGLSEHKNDISFNQGLLTMFDLIICIHMLLVNKLIIYKARRESTPYW